MTYYFLNWSSTGFVFQRSFHLLFNHALDTFLIRDLFLGGFGRGLL
jgi:hypothetical protein